jgi:exopolyphosphatase/guanosine-5'-triphosphate,3'-diphosphate pyrophosphatase
LFEGVHVAVGAGATVLMLPDGRRSDVPWGYETITAAWLADADPPHPAGLTNALGAVEDHLDDVEREHPDVRELARTGHGVAFTGETITSLARLELGRDDAPPSVDLDRVAAEDIFRLVATESAADRRHNPGLPSKHVDTIVATCCVVLSVMRRFHLERVILQTGGDASEVTT